MTKTGRIVALMLEAPRSANDWIGLVVVLLAIVGAMWLVLLIWRRRQ